MSASDGKRALFSTAVRKPGTLVVVCGSCHGRSRLSYLELVKRSVPITAWLPWRTHSRLVRCPACEHRTWVAARWFD
ncbi:MAG: hypothetical protein ABJC79_01515 [Acidimicrobiia bacterium]